MAFKLTKAEEKTREELMVSLSSAAETLDHAVQAFNEVLEGIGEFRTSVFERADSEMEEKSEKWQESKAGELAQAWLEARNEEFDPVELDTSEYTVAFEELPASYKSDDD